MQKQDQGKTDKTLSGSILWAAKSFSRSVPIILGVLLLMGLFQNYVPVKVLMSVFNGNMPRDTVMGALAGSVSAGNAVSSYIIAAELLKKGVTLFAVIAFMVTWVTVGIAQMPAEMAILGKGFALTRNLMSFLLAIAIAMATTLTWMVLS